jgi:hypothetical protein
VTLVDIAAPAMTIVSVGTMTVGMLASMRRAPNEGAITPSETARRRSWERWQLPGRVLVWDPELEAEVLDGETPEAMVERMERPPAPMRLVERREHVYTADGEVDTIIWHEEVPTHGHSD